MAAQRAPALRSVRQQVEVCLGKAGLPVGTLVYVQQGRRENSAFGYGSAWLADPARFNVSGDLHLVPGFQAHKAASAHDPVFHGALADTAPDAWGRRVIAREHARRRSADPELPALTELDYLLAVDDFSRVGALRLRSEADGAWHRTPAEARRATPPVIELQRIYQASHAVERGQESDEDLRYLQGLGTSLGGMRPKCTMVEVDGTLAIGKFPSVSDTRSVTRGEVLAMKLAQQAGVNAASARVLAMPGDDGRQPGQSPEVPVAVIRRFDRSAEGARIPYQSAATLLQASREEDRSYSEIADAIRSHGHAPTEDVQQLWRRMVFNLLITNVDDHLQNHGFLHVARGQWRLAPAFDPNPFPDKNRESKTWLTERDGPIAEVRALLARAAYFALDEAHALAVLGEVHAAVANWRQTALSAQVGLRAHELNDFTPAFEHGQMKAAAAVLGR